jgi:hypothetical protein
MTSGDLPKPSRRMSRTFSKSIRKENVADHAAPVGVMGSLTKPSFRISNTFGPTERLSATSSALLILDP